MVTLVEHTIHYPWGPDQWAAEYDLDYDQISDFIKNGISLEDKRNIARDLWNHMTDKEKQELIDFDWSYEDIDHYDEIDLEDGFALSDYLRELIDQGEYDKELEEYFRDDAHEYFFG